MTDYNEEDYLMISGIQHYVFCRRQWALIHIEQQWEENLRTIEGEIMHEKAHDHSQSEKRGNIILSRGMMVFSSRLGLNGTCDVVELKKDDQGVEIFGREGTYQVVPVEYKRGKPKENDSDVLQLCAQAICLEEMLLCHIPEAYIYYGETKHRLKVILDEELRAKVVTITVEMHKLYEQRHTPKVKISYRCKACSLNTICMPKLCQNISASDYIKTHVKEALDEEVT
jgi:CRISPR-associated exonuclease Cas4